MIDDINKFRNIYKLKEVYRAASVLDRKESSAEHTWSALMLADYCFEKFDFSNIDKQMVFELLLYHDLVEIESGDTKLAPGVDRNLKKNIEDKAAKELFLKLPNCISNKFLTLFNEFEAQETIESRFAKVIDLLDSEIHELDYKKDWIGWSEDFLRNHKEKFTKEFPELHKILEATISFCKDNGFFNQ